MSFRGGPRGTNPTGPPYVTWRFGTADRRGPIPRLRPTTIRLTKMSKYPQRKHIRLRRELYNNPSYAFLITICTYQRRKLFYNKIYADPVFSNIKGFLSEATKLYAASLLPDHLYLLLSPTGRNLINVIGGWKAYTTNILHDLGLFGTIWQTSFYDHVLRKADNIKSAGEYILANPVRLGLCEDHREYRYNYLG